MTKATRRIADVITARGIREVLHFTTNSGLTGILASQRLQCREGLSSDKYLEYIYKQNCPDRSKDAAWHGYVNLSITRINAGLFSISEGKWHAFLDGWWCVLAFEPDILTHDGVYFTTTNNIYTGVRRGQGAEGLEGLFAPEVVRWSGNVVRRGKIPDSVPTCVQAEVLYPGELSIRHLTRIYLRQNEHADGAWGICAALGISKVPCVVNAKLFRGEPSDA